jgi:Tfp pilus assembly protein PilO
MSAPSSANLWRERLTSPLVWHYAGAASLLLLTIVLGVRLGMDWSATHGHSSDVLAGKQAQLRALDLQTAPLRGLDKSVEQVREQMGGFYSKRVPPNYSAIAGRVGDLQVKSGVRLTRVQYAQGKPGNDLTEILLDISISGGYPEILRFVNTIERDPMFFVIRAMSLTGQQGGAVNLRLQVSTWLRPADAVASGLPTKEELDAQNAQNENSQPNNQPNNQKEAR